MQGLKHNGSSGAEADTGRCERCDSGRSGIRAKASGPSPLFHCCECVSIWERKGQVTALLTCRMEDCSAIACFTSLLIFWLG